MATAEQRYSRADFYRRRGMEAQQRATKATNPNIKHAFEDVARGWFLLAEQVNWLDSHYRDAQHDKKE